MNRINRFLLLSGVILTIEVAFHHVQAWSYTGGNPQRAISRSNQRSKIFNIAKETTCDTRFASQRQLPSKLLLSSQLVDEEIAGLGDDDDLIVPKDATFFIRRALPTDTGRASELLTNGFFKNANPLSHMWERFNTYLSVDVDFPQPLANHEIFVACDNKSGRILGLAEVDARINEKNARGKNGPYMCNLAVDNSHKRKGIASALVKQCEFEVQQWHIGSTSYQQQQHQRELQDGSTQNKSNKSSIIPNSLSLKVRQSNDAAVSMYDKLGYRTFLQESEKDDKGETVFVMRKQLPSLLLKQLVADQQKAQTESTLGGDHSSKTDDQPGNEAANQEIDAIPQANQI